MNDDPSPSPLSEEDAALEARLQQWRPLPPAPGLQEALFERLASEEQVTDQQIAADLQTQLQPKGVAPDLWDRIAANLDGDLPAEAESPESKIISFPHWREFTPLFRVAAAVAIAVLVTSAWLRPDPNSGGGTAAGHGQRPVTAQPAELGPPMDLSKVVPVGRRGYVQGMESRGLMEHENRMYEKFLQTRKDHTLYQLPGDRRVEDEVSREGTVVMPLPIF